MASIGPVEDLESYVKADWWREIFNANYLRTDGDVVEDAEITKNEISLLASIIPLKQDSYVMDLCCGQGRHCIELAKRGHRFMHGLDRSHYLITRAKAVAKREGVSILFKEGDARKVPFPTDTFDFVSILGNSFGYFESLQDDRQVLQGVNRVLKPGGSLVIDITDGAYMKESFQPRSWEWIDKNYFVCRERSLSKDMKRLVSREVITHVTKGVVADQFYAERLYERDDIQQLLKEAGFSDIMIHSDMCTDSKRNQDLGMMERRIIITGVVKKEWTPVKKVKDKRTVAVLMGDPRLSDIVKPNGTFDDDDFQTIDRLKEALASLKEYSIYYFNNHSKYMHDLFNARKKFDFVFNLCDEGFGNDATKELHVPALLEMLDIPYSGGTPQCLAFCYDKSLVRGIAHEMGIPVPQAFLINSENVAFIDFPIEFPVLVKPNFGDSSFGITQQSVCNTVEELENALLCVRTKMGFDRPVLVEQFLTGKDISVGIIGNPPESYRALPIIEEDYSVLPDDMPKICGYEAKWDPSSPYWKLRSIPADLPDETKEFLVVSCINLFKRLECRDYARFDWRLDDNETPRLLEVNPNPGWCWDGHLAKMAKLEGREYPDMLRDILHAVERRIKKEMTKTAEV
ncbi:MAG: methyltransferase domain-containing protein [Candidatus Omnitrophica bacterium]|nr:methyltransferase domain-containing protein [Candidatus Omnitrophota bacterium]